MRPPNHQRCDEVRYVERPWSDYLRAWFFILTVGTLFGIAYVSHLLSRGQ